ncbi:alkaline phosphatase-like protein [Zopfia rhizophila CBS 207.26]|uniref:Alkaline phosphatase-like protein n=1 Tax=Zopfia rhizophila CBS 207.26 TaxID=1314779 RepID=A0A6A6DL50_9PEZI|nr:alkaline phosphatase-like protein [Zopfia rhizophila CBS 207.26]
MKLSIVVTGLSILLSSSPTTAQNAAAKPNIVFILTDDQDARMNSLEHMPKVQDLLIKQGTSYVRHYAPTALCCPARVSIWTGLHSHNHGVASVHNGPFGGWEKILKQGLNDKYLPIWLRNNGYRTYYTGKLYNGMEKEMVEKETAKGWTEADLLVGGSVYQYYDPSFQHIENNNWQNPGKVKDQPGNYSTDVVADYAYGYLRDALKHDDPFFVGIAPITPHVETGKTHGPPQPAKKYNNTRPNAKVPPADNWNPANRSGVNVVWQLDPLNDNKVKILQEHYQRRTEALLSVDDIVEKVIDILTNANKLNNTYIIYSSDNGFHIGHHRLGPGKKYAFEEDINVPLIVRGPNVPQNKKTDIVTAHVDLSPTILKMAGVPQRADFDGRPIPITAGDIQQREGSDGDEYSGVEFWEGASYSFNGLKGTRVNSYKSLRLAGKGYDIMYAVQCHNNSHELYNMNQDPVQMRNLHPTAPHEPGKKNPYDSGEKQLAGYDIPRLIQRVDALLMVLKSCQGNSCSKPWQELHPNGQVKNLRDAMDSNFDEKYKNIKSVKFNKCYKDGTIDIGAEGPQWKGNDQVDVGPMGGLNQTTFTTEEDENFTLGWEREGYWDDWE